MTNQQSFPLDDPLFKAAPKLKKAMFPTLSSFSHKEALQACFEVLSFMNNTQQKPTLHPFSKTIEEAVTHMAESCGFMSREINIHKIDLSRETNSAIVFCTSESMPGLIYFRNGVAYLYNPSTGANKPLKQKTLKAYQMMGFALYKKWPQDTKTVMKMAKLAYKECHKELKLFLILQGIIGLLMLLQPLLTGILFDNVVKLRQYSLIDQVFLGLVAATIGTMVFKVVQNFAIVRFQVKSSLFLESALWNRLLSFSFYFFKIFRLGDLHDRLMVMDQIQEELTTSTMNALSQGFFSIIILTFISFYLPLLGLIIFLATLVFGIISVFIIRRIVSYNRAETQTNARLMSFLFEAIRSVVKVKASGSKTHIFQKWLNMEFTKMSHSIGAQYLFAYYQIIEFAFPVIISVSLYFLMVDVDPLSSAKPALPIGKFITVQMALGQYFASLMGMVGVLDKLLRLIPHMERVRPILKEKSEQDGEQKVQTILKGEIVFRNVSFSYSSTGPLILDNVSFTINAGEWVAIVGPSGAGKTTLIRLILGLEKCQKGTILLDGVPLDQLDMPTMRRQIATVLQHTQLLPGSIFDNLHASNPNLTEEEMFSLLQLVAMDEDVANMPMGLSTVIMGDGRTFSMGQRQRLVLARCLAKPLSVILLDEATSALDNVSQSVILNTLKQIPITRVTVAHRPSTIQQAERVIMMDKGRIVEPTT